MKLGNFIHIAAMLFAMVGLLGVIGWILAGRDGVVITAGMGTAFLMFGRGLSRDWMLKAIGTVPLKREHAPGLYAILDELCRRAGLAHIPELHLLESDIMLGFSAGSSERDAAIVMTEPLVRSLSAREIASVLAHEIAHIHGGDLVVMGMADVVTRMTRTLSLLGLLLVVFNVPLWAGGQGALPWSALVLLIMAPMVNFLIQMALSRAREFQADQGGVDLCGDPEALARALQKLERQQNGLLRSMFLPHEPGTEPSMLRSHPITAERVEHIMRQTPALGPLPAHLIGADQGFPPEWPGEFSMPVRWLFKWWR